MHAASKPAGPQAREGRTFKGIWRRLVWPLFHYPKPQELGRLHFCVIFKMLEALFASVHTIFPDGATYFIPASAVVSIIFAVWLWARVSAVRVAPATHTRSENGARVPSGGGAARGRRGELGTACNFASSLASCRCLLSDNNHMALKSLTQALWSICRWYKRLLIFRMQSLRVPTVSCSQSTSTWPSSW